MILQIKGYNEVVNKINDLETNKAVVDGITDSLIAENKRLANELHRLEARIDDNEQRNRNNCLLLHGIEETDNTDTDQIVCEVINKEIGITLLPSDIHRSHRLGPPKSSRNTRSNKVNPRPIIFRFVNFKKRQEVFYSKRKLKGKNISLSENLTPTRYKLLKDAQAKFGIRKVWSTEGRVTTKINNRSVTINNYDDLQRY